MDIKLSKDADALICVLYKNYYQQRKDGVPKSEAKKFKSSYDIQMNLIPKWNPEDVDDTCRELDDKGLLYCFYAENIAWEVHLLDDGIIYMENRFNNDFAKLIEYMTKFLPFLL